MIVAFISILFVLLFSVIGIAASILSIVGKWKVFEKASKPGWASIVPYYNTYVTYQLGNFPPLLCLLSAGTGIMSFIIGMINSIAEILNLNIEIVSIICILLYGIVGLMSTAALIVDIMANINIAKKFNKSPAYGVGLSLLPFVFYMMLAYDKNAVYVEQK